MITSHAPRSGKSPARTVTRCGRYAAASRRSCTSLASFCAFLSTRISSSAMPCTASAYAACAPTWPRPITPRIRFLLISSPSFHHDIPKTKAASPRSWRSRWTALPCTLPASNRETDLRTARSANHNSIHAYKNGRRDGVHGKYGSMRLRAGGSGTEGLCRTGGMELHRRPGHRSRFLSLEMLRF